MRELILVAAILFPIFLLGIPPDVNNNTGIWTDNFNDQLGIETLNNLTVDVINGTVMLASGQTSGSQTSVLIDPPAADAWQSVCLDATFSATTNLTIDILNGADDTPITGFQNLDMGLMDVDGCIDIAAIDINTYPTLKIRINHTAGTTTPIIQQLTIKWNPITFLLFDKIAPEEVGAGQSFAYKIRISANFVDAENVVVWDTLPKLSRNTVTYESGEDYGQNDEPILSTIQNPDGSADTLISHNGKYTASAISVNGVNIPAHAIYWTFDKIVAGNSIILQALITAPNGTLDGTQYHNAANVEVSNGENRTTATVITTVRSTPAPNLAKAEPTLDRPTLSKVYQIEDQNLVLVGTSLRFYLKDPDGLIDGNDYNSEFRESMYNTVLWDNIDSLLSHISGSPFDISGTKYLADGTSSTIAGTYTTTPVIVGSTSIPANSVYWSLGKLAPGDGFSMDFKVTLDGAVPDGTDISNFAYLDSDQTDTIIDELAMIVVTDIPGAGYCCKEGYFPTFPNNEQDLNCTSQDGSISLIYGEPIQYKLNFRNTGGTTLQDMVFFDRVSDQVDFVSADFQNEALVGGSIFYYTGTSYTDSLVHPPFDYALLPNPGVGWSSAPPAIAADVTWVAWTVPQMSSSYFPPAAPITQVTAIMNVVTDDSPANPCDLQRIYNTKLVEVNAETPAGGSKTAISPAREHIFIDTTSLQSNIGEFATDASDIQLTAVTLVPGNANYAIKIKNRKSTRSDYFTNVSVKLEWTQLNVNGVPTYPTFVNATGGTITNFDPVNGTVTLDIGALAQDEEKEVAMELTFPTGTEDLSTYKVIATMTGLDDECGSVTAAYQKTGSVSGTPTLQVFKNDVVAVIPSAGQIRYQLEYRNIGETPSTNTWIVDRIPFNTTFVSATAPVGETVWFTDKLPPNIPANQISVVDPIDFTTIQQHFSPGVQDDMGTGLDFSDDVWTSPFGDQTTWIAWKVDDPSLSPNQLPVEANFRMVELTVQNDHDGTGPLFTGSPNGSVIFNEAAIFSKQNLLAIGNEIRTTIEDYPGLELSKRSDVEIVTSAESFNWIIDYKNNSHATDDTVTITDILPAEIVLDTIFHQWNALAIANGESALENDLTANANVVITSNVDGTSTVVIKIAGSPALKGNLLSEEGGTIRLAVHPQTGTPSGVMLENEVCGLAQNNVSTTYLCDEDVVTVLNPDLLVSKFSSIDEPNDGDTITYTLLIANRGLHMAENVVIEDVLPTGASYIAGSSQILTAGYSISEPVGTTTLIWNDLQATSGGTAGTLLPSSADIYLAYKIEITGAILDMPTNTVSISTSDPEDTNYPNMDTVQVLIPPPDPSVSKTGQLVAGPADAVTWTLDYHNTRNAAATGVYLIETLPDFDNDGTADVDFINTTIPTGVSIYYSDVTGSPPAFVYTNPTGSGDWGLSPGDTVNHIAYLVGDLAANAPIASINVSASLKEPGSGALPPAGTTFSNQVAIFLNETEGDLTNNVDTFDTKIPGVDVSIEKEGSTEGGFPGLRPGDPISYTFTVRNTGTVTAHGLSITDQLPSNFIPSSPFDEFALLEVFDELGLPTTLLDTFETELSIPIAPTRTGTVSAGNLITWYLGSTTSSSDPDYYRNVGLPVGCSFSFNINGIVAGDAIEGDKVKNSTTIIYEGIPSSTEPEEFLTNNTDSTTVSIYQPDVSIQKSVLDKPSNDDTWTESGNNLIYTLAYNNLGNAGADQVVISEIIPEGTEYVAGSLTLPPSASVEWFPSETAPTSFDINIPFLPSPANYDGGIIDATQFLNSGFLGESIGLIAVEEVTGNSVTPAAPAAPAPPVLPVLNPAPIPSPAPMPPGNPTAPTPPALQGSVTLNACNCGTQTDIPEIECEALVALYNSTDGDNWTNIGADIPWGSDNAPSGWMGITVASGHVDRIDLFNKGLDGTLPAELGNLTDITYFRIVNNNELDGAIPAELGNLTNITSFQLQSNSLTGTIPPHLANLSNAVVLSLYSNDLTDTIPRSFGNFPILTTLYLYNNDLSGSIPAELANVTTLSNLRLYSNNFTGGIPPELGLLTNLTDLRLHSNLVGGNIPPELGNLVNLNYLYLNSMDLTDTIPAELGHLSGMSQRLYLYDNNLTGSIPPELGYLSSVSLFRLDNNMLSGSIPPELGHLRPTSFWIYQNNLTDTIPAALGNMTTVTNFDISLNQLTGGIPPALGNLVNASDFHLNDNQLTCHLPEALANIPPSTTGFRVFNNKIPFDGAGPWPNISVSTVWNNYFGSLLQAYVETQNALDGSEDLSECLTEFPTSTMTIVDIPLCDSTQTINSWLSMELDQTKPANTEISYTIYPADTDMDGDCSNNGSSLLGPFTSSMATVNIASIDTTNACLCVEASLTTTDPSATPVLDTVKLSYSNGEIHYFNNTGLAIDGEMCQGVALTNAGSYATNGTFATAIESDTSIISWDVLRTDQLVPTGAELTYTLYTQGISAATGCTGTAINGFENFSMENGFKDISTIPVSNTQLCLEATMKSNSSQDVTPCLNAWQATYISDELPKITFEVKVDDPVSDGQTQINNIVNISTITPEKDSNVVNNTGADSIFLRFTDLEIVKSVDKATVLAPDDETIIYTLNGKNNGPQDAINVVITDVLPLHLAYDNASPVPTSVDTDYNGTGRTALIWNLGDQSAGAFGTITVTTHEVDATAGTNLSNIVSISNDRQETDYDNNEDQAITIVESIANIYIKKSGPTSISLNEIGQFQLIYGNNGNNKAGNVILTDTIPFQFRPDTVYNDNCTITFQTVVCNIDSLSPGQEDTILIDFLVAPATSLVGNSYNNIAQITTDSSETDLADNQDQHSTYINPLEAVALSGTVWHDDDRNGLINDAEMGIEGVPIHLSGTDVFGASVNQSTHTDANGFYLFSGLVPGDYAIEEEQPTGWLSSPYVKLGAALLTSDNPQDTILNYGTIGTLNSNEAFLTLSLDEGYRGIEYNFGEDLGSIGDTVWIDNNVNGVQDSGEQGVARVAVRLYQQSNDSLIGSEVTNALGAYLFEDLYANDYYAVFDLTTLPDSINRVTLQNAAAATTFTDSDADPTSGATMVINLTAGANDLSWDMGIYGAILIGNKVWYDEDGNGQQSGAEAPLSDINVTLFNLSGDSITTVQTDVDGKYYFHTDSLALYGSGADTLFYANTDYYLVVGKGGHFSAIDGLLVDTLQITTDSIGISTDDSDGELAIGIDPDFDGFPYVRITTPAFGQADTTFDFGFRTADMDFGDLSDTSSSTNYHDYHTLESNDGPRHIIIAGLSLGATVDAEPDGQPDSLAAGDGIDEDALTILASLDVVPGGKIRLPFNYTNTTGSTAQLRIWIDWNADGYFDPSTELAVKQSDASGSFGTALSINIPDTAATGLLLGMRVRLSLENGMTPYGKINSGEVEDYLIGVDCPQVICIPSSMELKKE